MSTKKRSDKRDELINLLLAGWDGYYDYPDNKEIEKLIDDIVEEESPS